MSGIAPRRTVQQAVDAAIRRLPMKAAVRVCAVSPVTLEALAPLVVDGVTLAADDRVLVQAQAAASQNGLYRVLTPGTGATGTWIRAIDFDTDAEVHAGDVVIVAEGTLYADSLWELATNDPIVVGTTGLSFALQSSSGGIAGDLAIRTLSASGSLVGTDDVVRLNATAAPVVLTLTDATTRPGRAITVKRVSTGANGTTIAAASGQTVGGAATRALVADDESTDLVAVGTDWMTR